MPPLRLLRFSQLDLPAWDACVARARQPVPYAHSWWLQATAGRWDALVQVASDGRYLSVWPLPAKWRPGGRQVYQPPFTQQLGLLSCVESAPAIGPELPQLARRYARFYTQLNEANGLPDVAKDFAVEARQTYQLDLSSDYQTMRAGYCADYRRRLLRHEAAAAPLAVTNLPDAAPLLALFQQTKGPAAGLRPRHYARLRRLLAELHSRQLLEARAVRQPETGALLAGALFVRYRSRLIYLFAAASDEGKKAAAPVLLLDDAIRRHAGTPGLVLDFEGGMLPAIARFFANFGAASVPYAALSFTSQRPWYLKWMR
ncbi:GNAT family N-acetyltransferase [Hymenobacter psychrophilus]|uniref:Acetyltransferase (GNAT) domain-containing protein n=1 Tax=Hymenobacter psychrophilus TaxID=651662 RepID=A0A1H3NQ77_9BACT|nr:GNAT family N-acetyltransferase [Hymenobacter psychrophilus]SDY91052.1 Acetyltransferase (GNAT) domain-containing protein [Hymenobacter psychrophilus]